MIVEIHILSGSRQGERIEFDRLHFRVGDQPDSEVYFDPACDPASGGRSAEFQFSESDGWTLRKLGAGDLLVNQGPVSGTTHVRSGDIVRLSDVGPDFVFTVLPHRQVGVDSLGAGQGGAALPGEAAQPAEVPVAGLVEGEVPLPDPLPKASTTGQWKMPALVGGAAVLGLIVLLLWPRPAPDPHGEFTHDWEALQPIQQPPALPPTVPSDPQPDERPDEPPRERARPWSEVLDQVREALFVIQVEDPTGQASWPIANACAIRADTLLTSGTAASAIVSLQATQLDNVELRSRKWSVWAQSATGLRRRVTTIRVHQGYEELPVESPEGAIDPRMYFYLALLTVEGTLPATLPIAPAAVEGLPVAAAGIPYRSERATRFQSYSAGLMEGRVEMLGHLDPKRAESPALLRITASIPLPEPDAMGPYMFGCPVIDRGGNLVGVYSSPGLTPEAQRANMHYAAETRLVALWLSGEGLGSWVEPSATVSSAVNE